MIFEFGRWDLHDHGSHRLVHDEETPINPFAPLNTGRHRHAAVDAPPQLSRRPKTGRYRGCRTALEALHAGH